MVGLANFNVFKAAQEYIVVTVNCRGAMGKGVALECPGTLSKNLPPLPSTLPSR